MDAWNWIDISHESQMATETADMRRWWTRLYQCWASRNLSTCLCLSHRSHNVNANFVCRIMHEPHFKRLVNTDAVIINKTKKTNHTTWREHFLFYSLNFFFIYFIQNLFIHTEILVLDCLILPQMLVLQTQVFVFVFFFKMHFRSIA